ncbi:MAG: YidC/Oxa1 family membrane protein insertase [Clostridia bacterium]|nr:YidC/Oxa1 family membrane protein insertase [Clostridia bacterium]
MSGYFQSILEWIFSWVGNYGWSIVVFTVLIRLVLLPLDIKSKKSMRAMNRIQPKVQALQKKYANDKDKLNVKLNELYRNEKVSPMAGCLPMLISLPVLWWMFGAMRNLGNEHTIAMILQIMETGEVPAMESWLWIKNVFQPDSFSSTILPTVNSLKTIVAVNGSEILTEANIAAAREFLGTAEYAAIAAQYGADQFIRLQLSLVFFNPVLTLPKSFAALFQYANGLFILPVLSAVSKFFMTKVTGGSTPAQDDNAGAEQQAAANAMNSGFMKWFFPLFSLYICAQYNAAFAIYWMAANVIQILQQVIVNWYLDSKDKKAALEADSAEIK